MTNPTRKTEFNSTAPGQVPEGFVLVPKEPTNSMVEAAELDAGGLLSVDDIVDAYRAMLAAAPSPDSGEVKP